MDNTGLHAVIWKCRFELFPPAQITWYGTRRRLYIPKMKELSDHYLNNGDDVITFVDHFLEVKNADLYKDGIFKK